MLETALARTPEACLRLTRQALICNEVGGLPVLNATAACAGLRMFENVI